MAFTVAGGVITQAGNDTDLSDLNGLAGVTTTAAAATNDGVTVYTINNATRLVISGNLAHNTERERIIIQRGVGANNPSTVQVTGTWNYGIPKNTVVLATIATLPAASAANNGEYRFVCEDNNVYRSDGTAWNIIPIDPVNPGDESISDLTYTGGIGASMAANTLWWNGSTETTPTAASGGSMVYIDDTGVFNINGASLDGRITLTTAGNGRIRNRVPAKVLINDNGQVAGQERITRLRGGVFDTTNLAYEGGSISVGIGADNATVEFDRSGAGVAYWTQHSVGAGGANFDGSNPATYPTIRNVSFFNNTVDFAPYRNSNTVFSGVRLQNLGGGTNVNINGGEIDAAARPNNAGYTWVTRELDTNLTRLVGGDAQGSMWLSDTLRNTADDITGQENATYNDNMQSAYRYDYEGDAISNFTVTGGYAAQTCIANGGDNEILLATHNLNRTGTAWVRDAANIWNVRRTSISGEAGNDNYLIHDWSYEHGYTAWTPNLAGEQPFVFEQAKANDPFITGTRAVTAGISGNVVITATTLESTGIVDLDQLYDICQYQKETIAAQQTIPTNATMAVTSDGAVVTVDSDLDFSLGAGSIFEGVPGRKTTLVTDSFDVNSQSLSDLTFIGTISNIGRLLRCNITSDGDETIAVSAIPLNPTNVTDSSLSVTSNDLTLTSAATATSIFTAATLVGPATDNGSTFNATTTLTLDSVFTDTTINTPEVTGVDADTFVSGIEFSQATELDISGFVAGVYTADQILGDDYVTNGNIDLTSSTSGIVVSTTDANIVSTDGTVTVRQPDLLISVDATAVTNPFYRVYIDNVRQNASWAFGPVTSNAIEIPQSALTTDDYRIAVTSSNGFDTLITGNYAGGDISRTIDVSPFVSTAIASTAVSVSTTESTDTTFVIDIDSGAALNGGVHNVSIAATRGSQQYADYLANAADLLKGLQFPLSTQVTYFNDGTHSTRLSIGDGPTSVALQGGGWVTDVTGAGAIRTALTAGTQGNLNPTPPPDTFNADITIPAEGTGSFDGGTTTITLRIGVEAVEDTVIDYDSFGSISQASAETAIQGAGLATAADIDDLAKGTSHLIEVVDGNPITLAPSGQTAYDRDTQNDIL